MKKKTAWLLICFVFFSSCAGMQKITMHGNQSVGDNWKCYSMSPEGIVDVSIKYRILLPFPGMSGTFTFRFKALAKGEAEIVLGNFFRGGKPRSLTTYKAVVDKWKRLTLERIETRYPEVAATFEIVNNSSYDLDISFYLAPERNSGYGGYEDIRLNKGESNTLELRSYGEHRNPQKELNRIVFSKVSNRKDFVYLDINDTGEDDDASSTTTTFSLIITDELFAASRE